MYVWKKLEAMLSRLELTHDWKGKWEISLK